VFGKLQRFGKIVFQLFHKRRDLVKYLFVVDIEVDVEEVPEAKQGAELECFEERILGWRAVGNCVLRGARRRGRERAELEGRGRRESPRSAEERSGRGAIGVHAFCVFGEKSDRERRSRSV